jgi:DNA-binding IclR family transcriptional regulator
MRLLISQSENSVSSSKPTSVEKALNILLAFNPKNLELGTTDLTRITGFHVATVSRTLKILTRKGFLQQNPLTRKFRLGLSIFSLGQTAMESVSEGLTNVAMPVLGELGKKLGETVVIEMVSGGKGIITYVVQGAKASSIRGHIGGRVAIHARAGTKTILAYSKQEVVDDILKNKLARLTHKTITDPEKFRRHIEKIKKQGVGFCQEEIDIGINAIGVPIFNHKNEPAGSVVVIGPSPRIKCKIKSPIVAELRKAASEIAAQLFHNENP